MMWQAVAARDTAIEWSAGLEDVRRAGHREVADYLSDQGVRHGFPSSIYGAPSSNLFGGGT
jgi:hypothetical protein